MKEDVGGGHVLTLTFTSAFLLSKVLAAAMTNKGKHVRGGDERTHSGKQAITFSAIHNVCDIFHPDFRFS